MPDPEPDIIHTHNGVFSMGGFRKCRECGQRFGLGDAAPDKRTICPRCARKARSERERQRQEEPGWVRYNVSIGDIFEGFLTAADLAAAREGVAIVVTNERPDSPIRSIQINLFAPALTAAG